MTAATTPSFTSDSSESGYVLIGVLFLVVILLIGLAVAAPKVATEIRRDKELELYHRGMQYSRAIHLYYKKFGNYPISLDQLQNTNNLKFLRRRYKDPMTGKDDWKLIHMGEATVPQTGLFGQPTGTTAAGQAGNSGTGSNSGPGASSGSGFGGNSGSSFGSSGGSSFGNNSGSSFGNSGGSSFGNSFGGNSGSTGGSSFGNSFSNGGSSSPGSGAAGGTGSTDPNSGATSGSAFGNSGGNTGGATGLGNSSLSSTNGSPIGSTGPIVGVASISKKESIREFKKQKHYNQWEFVYNPAADMGGIGGNTGSGMLQQNGNTNNSFGNSFGNSSGSSFGNSSGSSFGNNSGSSFGNSNGNQNSTNPGGGTTSPAPTPPTNQQ